MKKTCFVSIDIERDNFGDKNTFEGVESLDKILDIFKKHKVEATLFVTGTILERYHDLVLDWAKDYEIGCHNYFHKSLDQLSVVEREKQLKRFISIYQTIFKKAPKGFRAPQNVIDNEQFEILQRYDFLYDASVIPSHIFLHKYKGYKGRAPKKPYYPSDKDYLKKGNLKILEIPVTPLFSGIPFAATWIRRLRVRFFKLLLKIKKPRVLSLTMHSWDSGTFLKQLDEILGALKEKGYIFKRGEEIYEAFSLYKR